MPDIKILQDLCKNHKIRWTNHILARLIKRHIHQSDVENAILTGKIIEQYPDDYPFPSCLILGFTVLNKFLHVVVSLNEGHIYLITAYYPSKDVWEADMKTRSFLNEMSELWSGDF